MSGSRFTLEVQPRLPEALARLEELANNLLYSWDRRVRGLFYRLDRELWERSGHNPKVFLRRIAQQTLDDAVRDRGYMEDYRRAVTGYDAYLDERAKPEITGPMDPDSDLVAYFCAEFGLYESFPLYSGGLGILAGDHCKAASDLGIPFIGVGLLYQRGYFTQSIDAQGHQLALYPQLRCEDLPIVTATVDGKPLLLDIEFPGRKVHVRVWEARAGHIRLYLLDTDVVGNSDSDRGITHQLYGGDSETRIQQEIILGIGGVRALNRLGLTPTAWHINEGHSAFQILERCRQYVADGLDFDSALELVAAGTVFTTHTPVSAGHDMFSHEQVNTYFAHYARELGIDFPVLFELGRTAESGDIFNMTTLALKGTRFHNGVSRIHGAVASEMESGVWPQIPPEENPIDYITNGVHVPTFLASEWVSLFDMRFDDWKSALIQPEFWECIDEVPDYQYWSIRKSLKQQLLTDVCQRVVEQHERYGSGHSVITGMTAHISDPDRDILVMGFARRFATYKRATLLFSDPERLAALLNDPERPAVIIFAGKAHPNDQPGQQLIKVIHEFSLRPEFLGRIILLEGYDLELGRKLVAGVDVWLNTPEYPLEASGTSGQKAAINGAINVSVLDGWWGEGYNGENGFAITPRAAHFDSEYRNREEADDLLDLFEHGVIPTYYQRDDRGYSADWVTLSKASMKSMMPRFNAMRMVRDYVQKFYLPAMQQHAKMLADDNAGAQQLAAWKRLVRECWPDVGVRLAETPPAQRFHGEPLPVRVLATLNGLDASDVVVECLLGKEEKDGRFFPLQRHALRAAGTEGEETEFFADVRSDLPGLQYYKLRMYPHHPLLAHPFETGCMVWV